MENNWTTESKEKSAEQLADSTQSADITTTVDFQMDIQAEVDVETAGTKGMECNGSDVGPMMEESKIPARPKRHRKLVPAYESVLKKRLMTSQNWSNVKITSEPLSSSSSPSLSNASTNDSKQCTDAEQSECKMAKAKEKGKSAARKMISCTRSEILDSDDKTDKAANKSTVSGKN